MNVTTIQFIGLFIVTLQAGGTGGLHILMSSYKSLPSHQTVIAYDPKQLAATPVWSPAPANCVVNGKNLKCAAVGVQTIRFSGQIDPAPGDIIGAIPHISCCCPTAATFNPAFFDDTLPAGKRAGAHVFVDKGIAEAIPDANGRIDTVITMHTEKAGITITATSGAQSSTLVFNPGAAVFFMNTAPMQPMDKPHFYAYYEAFAGDPCQTDPKAKPSAGPPCGESSSACPLPKKTIKAARQAKPTAFDLAMARKINLVGKANHTLFDLGVDCSNTHVP